MLVNNVGATLGCILGLIIAIFISGYIAVIPFIIAIVLYNIPKFTKDQKSNETT